jgi:DNA excision repair protein ERCC-6
MDGSTAVGARARLVDDFNNNDRVFVFLLTTKVGGLGINLTGADRCAAAHAGREPDA